MAADHAAIAGLIVAVITAVGVLLERVLKSIRRVRMKSPCFSVSIDQATSSRTGSSPSPTPQTNPVYHPDDATIARISAEIAQYQAAVQGGVTRDELRSSAPTEPLAAPNRE